MKVGFAGSNAVAWSFVVQVNDTVTLLPPAISSAISHCLFTILVASATGWSRLFFTDTENLSDVPVFFNVARLGVLREVPRGNTASDDATILMSLPLGETTKKLGAIVKLVAVVIFVASSIPFEPIVRNTLPAAAAVVLIALNCVPVFSIPLIFNCTLLPAMVSCGMMLLSVV